MKETKRGGEKKPQREDKKGKELVSELQKPKARADLMVQSDTTGLQLLLRAFNCETRQGLEKKKVGERIEDRRRREKEVGKKEKQDEKWDEDKL